MFSGHLRQFGMFLGHFKIAWHVLRAFYDSLACF
ncbi:hypothetical protein E2C01_043414 [Portunus trituberculatus]|nr:hypothetical protein [Portunus trituberculatus]